MSEPIAWMHTNSKQIFKTEKPNQFDLPLFTPLYAHPMRDLTDKDIWKCHDETNTDNWVIDFARAIIKASRGEK